MVRKYVALRRPSDREREERMVVAAETVRSKSMSIRKAALEFKLTKTAIAKRLNDGDGVRSIGGQTVLSKEDEEVIAKLVDNVAEWGFPLGRFEIKLMVKDLLDSRNLVSRFKDNLPGDDWLWEFL